MKGKQRKIYLYLMGRIGNQLFEYAFAYALQQEYGNALIVIDESDVICDNWKNSLRDYNLPDVEYVDSLGKRFASFRIKKRIYKFYEKFIYDTDPVVQFNKEKSIRRC